MEKVSDHINLYQLLNVDCFMYYQEFRNLIPKHISEEDVVKFWNDKVFVHVERNTYLHVPTNKLHIYNGTVTSPIDKYTYLDGYFVSQTKSGSIYVTVAPTYTN